MMGVLKSSWGNFVVFLVKTLTSHSAFPSMITSSTQWQMGSVGGGWGRLTKYFKGWVIL